jgi:Icc-related predicted phosphoesterase
MVKHLYVMSDTHDDLEAVARAVDFSKSEGLPNSSWVHVGDLSLRPYTFAALRKLASDRNVPEFVISKKAHNIRVLEDYKRVLDESGLPYVAIPGNYDGPLGEVFGKNDLHNKTSSLEGLTVAGYGGGGNADDDWIGPGHMELLYRIGEIQLFDPKELNKLLRDNNPRIAVIHNPPYGLCDDMFNGQNVGTPTSTRYLQEDNDLALILSGHIHEAGPNRNNPAGVFGVRAIRKANEKTCYVVNPGNLGRFELINPQTLETARAFPYGTFVRVDTEDDGTPIRLVQYSTSEEGRRIGQVRVMRDIDLTKAA